MTTTDLKPGDFVQHPTRLLNGLVVHGDGESIRILRTCPCLTRRSPCA